MKTINNYKDLKSAIVGLHKTYVLEETRKDKGEKDLQKEYAENRRHLEKSVNYLRIMITKDSTYHRQQYTNYMRNNVVLLQEVNDLRKQVKTLQKEARYYQSRQDSMIKSELSHRTDSKQGSRKGMQVQSEKELKLQDLKIQELTDELSKLQEENGKLNNRPQASRGGKRLKPLEKDSNEEVKEEVEANDPRAVESEKRLEDFKDDEDIKQDETQNQEEENYNQDENDDNEDNEDIEN